MVSGIFLLLEFHFRFSLTEVWTLGFTILLFILSKWMQIK
jgi:hypothetical protein